MTAKPEWFTSDMLAKGAAVEASPNVRKALVSKMEMGEEPRQIRFIISNGSVDRDNDTIDPAGWDLGPYRSNPVVLWAHDHKCLPVAKAIYVGMDGGNLVAVAEFATHEFAETVYQLYRGGFMRATSVGFRALDYVINEERRGIDFKRQELLEFSAVPVPANAQALMAASKAAVDLEPLRKWMQGLIQDWPGELTLTGKAWDRLKAAGLELEQEAPTAPAVPDAPVEAPAPAEEAPASDTDKMLGMLAAMSEQVQALALQVASLSKDGELQDEETEITPTDGAPAEAPAVEVQAEAPAAEPIAEDGVALDLDDDKSGGPVLELADDDEFEWDANEYRAALAEVVPAAVRELTRELTQQTINRLRGRLD